MPACVPTSCPACKLARWRNPGEQKNPGLGVFWHLPKPPVLGLPPQMSVPSRERVSGGNRPRCSRGSVFPTDLQRAPELLLNCVGVGARWEAATPAQSGTKIGAPALPFGAVPIPGHVGVMEGGMLLMEWLENPKLSTGALSGGFPKSQASCGRC